MRLHSCVRAVYWILSCSADSSHFGCLIRFVFLRSELCLQLPSDSTLRWAPLPLASGWQLPVPTADSHRQVTRHAWRTLKNKGQGDSLSFGLFVYLFFTPQRFSASSIISRKVWAVPFGRGSGLWFSNINRASSVALVAKSFPPFACQFCRVFLSKRLD